MATAGSPCGQQGSHLNTGQRAPSGIRPAAVSRQADEGSASLRMLSSLAQSRYVGSDEGGVATVTHGWLEEVQVSVQEKPEAGAHAADVAVGLGRWEGSGDAFLDRVRVDVHQLRGDGDQRSRRKARAKSIRLATSSVVSPADPTGASIRRRPRWASRTAKRVATVTTHASEWSCTLPQRTWARAKVSAATSSAPPPRTSARRRPPAVHVSGVVGRHGVTLTVTAVREAASTRTRLPSGEGSFAVTCRGYATAAHAMPAVSWL